MRASLLARDPVIAEKQDGSEKAYSEKVVVRGPIQSPLFITAVWPSWGGKPARSTALVQAGIDKNLAHRPANVAAILD